MNMKSLFVAIFVLLLAGGTWATHAKYHHKRHRHPKQNPTQQHIAPHIWSHINVADQANWNGRLAIISSDEPAYFTDKNGTVEGEMYDFTLNNKTSPFAYGFGFKQGDDFNVSYTQTLYQPSEAFKGISGNFFTSKVCLFIVSATGAAQPDVRIEKYNGANCSYKFFPGQDVSFDFTVG